MSKVIQLTTNRNSLYALRDDGSIWYVSQCQWFELAPPMESSTYIKPKAEGGDDE